MDEIADITHSTTSLQSVPHTCSCQKTSMVFSAKPYHKFSNSYILPSMISPNMGRIYPFRCCLLKKTKTLLPCRYFFFLTYTMALGISSTQPWMQNHQCFSFILVYSQRNILDPYLFALLMHRPKLVDSANGSEREIF